LQEIVFRTAAVLGVSIIPEAALEVASRARGTPRIANRLLKRVRDFAQVKSEDIISVDTTRAALNSLEVDPLGLDRSDRQLLQALINNFGGGPVGLDTLAAILSEDAGTIEEVYEPFLLQQGLIMRTARGRMATPLAYQHLGLSAPLQSEQIEIRGNE
jgi:Holliday junction DNA helicase RuvB